MLILYTIISNTVVGYVQNLSPLKRSRKGTSYFNAILQSGQESFHHVVCFSPEKRARLEEASNAKETVCISPVKRNASKLKLYQDEVILSHDAIIQNGGETTYHFSEFSSFEEAPFVKVSDLSKYGNKPVSCNLYINVSKCPSIPVMLPYRVETIKRKDCPANDETGCTVISL